MNATQRVGDYNAPQNINQSQIDMVESQKDTIDYIDIPEQA